MQEMKKCHRETKSYERIEDAIEAWNNKKIRSIDFIRHSLCYERQTGNDYSQN